METPVPRLLPLLAALAAVSSLGCSGGGIRRFPLREARWLDDDRRPFPVECRPDPEEEGELLCMPEPYESPFIWDGADNMIFRPVAETFAVELDSEAVNVNALDEVPDSSWFENRIGRRPMTPEEVATGPCGANVLDPEGGDGSWLVDRGKPNGAHPGFRVKVEGVGKFMLKADDPADPERATGATAIATRLYHAAGWHAACDSVVYLRRSLLRLKPGLEYADNSGIVKRFDAAALARVLDGAARRGGRVRMMASRWLPGRTLGPFRYEGTRADDLNDVIPHEHRRDLRGARVFAAWLGHYDSREQNSMDTWMSADPRKPAGSPGWVKHWYIDLGDCFGGRWEIDDLARRSGHAYYFDFGQLAADWLTLGAVERPWDRATRPREDFVFNYFSARDFEPEDWKGGYPNPAFQRMTERDGAWAARILARFDRAHLEAAVAVGDYSDPVAAPYLVDVLLARRDAILRRWFRALSPLADARVDGRRLCATDLALRARVFGARRHRWAAVAFPGDGTPSRRLAVTLRRDAEVCLDLPHDAPPAGPPADDPSRYLVVEVTNGVVPGPLRVHLYDLGPRRGFRLVGLERPEEPLVSSPGLR